MTRPYRDELNSLAFVYRNGQQHWVETDDDGPAYILLPGDGGYVTREYL